MTHASEFRMTGGSVPTIYHTFDGDWRAVDGQVIEEALVSLHVNGQELATIAATPIARDLGPRLMIVLAGFKNNGLTDGTWRFWVPIVAPLVGGVIGSVVYDQGIRRYLSEN